MSAESTCTVEILVNEDKDSQAWAEMLVTMYGRWAERHGYDFTRGVNRFTLNGPNAARLMAAECGVHRLVRVSPFDEQHRRQTCHATVRLIGAGSTVRSYILDPYTLARDHHSGAETVAVHGVLDGDLDLLAGVGCE